MSTVLEMMHELADFQKMPDGPQLTLDDLLRDGGFDDETTTSAPSMYICFVADIQQESSGSSGTTPSDGSSIELSPVQPLSSTIVGYAFCHYAYSSWLGKTLFLEDLYVKATQRYCGIGKQIFTKIVTFS